MPFSEHGPHYAFKIHSHAALLVPSDDPTLELWHARLAHFSVARIYLTVKELGVTGYRSVKPESCTACLKVRSCQGQSRSADAVRQVQPLVLR